MKLSTDWRKEIQTIPNLLSIFRIFLLPIYLYFVLRQSFYIAGAVIVVSGLSDYLDGVIARRYNQVTDLGKVLDPFADKLTQLFLILSMAWYRPWLWLLFGLFLIKEGFMFVAGLIGLSKNIKLSGAKWYGKVATAVIYVGMILLLLFPELPMLWVRVIFAVITYGFLQSFVLYAVEYRKMFQRK
ncbi:MULTISPECIES: CDP-alcohol phosphatidyltransferase family protein [Enterococcus]|uniref:CDP-alcohol phosphatidyltransferase family protein n=1 Tax=Enterococcus TaxID=1350 RepID=UPI000CF26D38|nr:CDP-alcohol phosphatidyltransferase family protein [Enterococcus faecium]EGP4985867.1 CDP-alcohol phosphatidyltransferase family protein [Enterococcus faecium]EGP5087850.1 CDP-alcohol phosphatidyltransferase family protein [Enterococcus faecium]EGP5139926.1 CDP-alcohol phosphatidyltransferase family protein [Enterococcus faecium]EME3546766.1 CDP-alcohol phosphatidyltransferase family protein [Enterococcus faecium]EME7137378.1 CDP-alcohol phosphatidyltransferase family protein [Enterococcus 